MTQEGSTAIGAVPNGDTTVRADAASVIGITYPSGLLKCGDRVDLEITLSATGFDGSLRLRFIVMSDGSQLDEVVLPVTGRSRVPYTWVARKGDSVWTDAPDVRVEIALVASDGALVGAPVNYDVLHIGRYQNNWRYRCVPGGNRRGERWTANAAGTLVHQPANPYSWPANYHLQYEDGVFLVQSRIQLVPQNGLVLTAAMKSGWKREIEQYWNRRYNAHRTPCGRGRTCSDPQGHCCCKFEVKVICNFVDSHPLTTVDVFPGAATGPWGSANWWYSSTWWELKSANVPSSVRGHEFGHNIGLWDEYNTGALKSGIDPNTYAFTPSSIMNAGSSARANHFTGWLYSAGQLVGDRFRAVRRT